MSLGYLGYFGGFSKDTPEFSNKPPMVFAGKLRSDEVFWINVAQKLVILNPAGTVVIEPESHTG